MPSLQARFEDAPQQKAERNGMNEKENIICGENDRPSSVAFNIEDDLDLHRATFRVKANVVGPAKGPRPLSQEYLDHLKWMDENA